MLAAFHPNRGEFFTCTDLVAIINVHVGFGYAGVRTLSSYFTTTSKRTRMLACASFELTSPGVTSYTAGFVLP